MTERTMDEQAGRARARKVDVLDSPCLGFPPHAQVWTGENKAFPEERPAVGRRQTKSLRGCLCEMERPDAEPAKAPPGIGPNELPPMSGAGA
jgi:hypothetical protein